MEENWVLEYRGTGRDAGIRTENLDGIDWADAGRDMTWLGRRLHWPHTPQTRGFLMGGIGLLERCKCGAIRADRGPWLRKVQL